MRPTQKKKELKAKLPAVRPSRTIKAQRMVEKLREQHSLGRAALQAQRKGASTADFAVGYGYSEHTMRKLKAFASNYEPADLETLCRGRRPNHLPLHWGYIPVFLAIKSKHGHVKWKQFQQEAIDKGWTVPELRRQVRDRLGVEGHGRAANLPKRPVDGLRSIVETLTLLERTCCTVIEQARIKRDMATHAKCRRLQRVLLVEIRRAGEP
jgi:hypothetical protein